MRQVYYPDSSISKWNEAHWTAAKHLLRYIRGTSDICLTFTNESGKRIALGYADADWGGDLDTRRSTTVYVFKVYGGIVAWKSRRQPTVALPTTEAEYMAAADATRQAIWLRRLLDELKLGLGSDPLPILNDDMGTIAISKHPVHHERTQHGSTIFFVRQNEVRPCSLFAKTRPRLAPLYSTRFPLPISKHH